MKSAQWLMFRPVLPTSRNDVIPSAIAPDVVTKVALRLKYQIEQVIPCELEEFKITKANSPVITRKVIATAKSAGGKEHEACVIYCLLVCYRWFRRQALLELWDADLYNVRATACEVLAKKIIELEGDQEYLLQDLLLKRYSILVGGEPTEPANAVERAVDLHALRVIGSSGYQKCITYLWRGWLIQDDQWPSNFIKWTQKANTNYWDHFDPDRMRAPLYQNIAQIFFSLLYLALYTAAINTINSTGDLDVVEGILYIMTAGYIFDEVSKFWKVGRYYIGFWNVFNCTLYALLSVSFVTRMIALGYPVNDDAGQRRKFNELSYNFLAFSAPMFWMRLLLYLDTFRFFGAMLVVLKMMMKESLIFFLLLIIVMIGFLQAFIGMDEVDDNTAVTGFIFKAMLNSVMQSPDFEGFDNFAPPFGLILYYIFTFVVMVGECHPNAPFLSPFSPAKLAMSTANKPQSSSTFSSPSITVPTPTSPTTPLTNTWLSSPKRPCNSSAPPTKTYSSPPSTSSRSSSSSFRLNGGCLLPATSVSTTT